MDFKDTPEEASFRAEARTFLDANAERKSPGASFETPDSVDELIIAAKAWQAKKAAAGFAGITQPEKYGGRGGTTLERVIYDQEEANYITPIGVYEIGLGMCIPTMLAYATEEQKKRYAPPAFRGEEIWCQLFSEPQAGSDLANLRLRAEQDGDDWILNGQKIWTSGAHFCDYGVIVTRSDPSLPKHKGLTYFFLDMKSPGVECRPIHQISGASNFNEVFFTDVRVPDSQRLGKIGDGWRVSLTTLMNERLAIGERPPPAFEEIFQLAKEIELEGGMAIEDGGVREKLADWYVDGRGVTLTRFRSLTALSRGQDPGPENSIGKAITGKMRQDIASFGMDLMDISGAVFDMDNAPMRAMFQDALLSAPSGRIAGGSDEILRNIIAERVLGLPQDVRVDKGIPFSELVKKEKA
ncbi:MAG: acyl-CoA dehydrogenase [Rhodospirillaceae bacterium]|jgi:alkylation response protein AidB-like acyl-CoA dehydrogenase|nr:acyl-CoA dehydrogenase [Rhodospirillaceae bacterium]